MLRLALLILVSSALPAAAHSGHGPTDTMAGFLHPLSGVDHVAAMVTVGAWSALAGGPRVWLWPLAFITAMIAGGALGHAGIAMPMVEQGIAASLIIVGLLLALAIPTPPAVGAALIAAFAIVHGHAHGTEAEGALWLPYMAGFVAATALLHLSGIGLARGLIYAFDTMPVRLIGAATAVAGAALLIT